MPLLEPEPSLLEDTVIPILDSIIGRGRGSSLKQLELPKNWRNRSSSTDMEPFLDRYNDYMRNQRYCCSKCEQVFDSDDDWIGLDGDEWHGTQNYTCSGCLKHFCSRLDCIGISGDGESIIWCLKCEKGYCKDCAAHNGEFFCVKCVGL